MRKFGRLVQNGPRDENGELLTGLAAASGNASLITLPDIHQKSLSFNDVLLYRTVDLSDRTAAADQMYTAVLAVGPTYFFSLRYLTYPLIITGVTSAKNWHRFPSHFFDRLVLKWSKIS